MVTHELEPSTSDQTEPQSPRLLEKVAHGFETLAVICLFMCLLCACRALAARIHIESSNAGWISLGFLSAAFLSVIVAQLMFIRAALETRLR